jgi:hypothetical protein
MTRSPLRENQPVLQRETARFHAHLGTPGSLTLVAEQGGVVIGGILAVRIQRGLQETPLPETLAALWAASNPEGELLVPFLVWSSAQGQARAVVARALITEALQLAKEMGIKEVVTYSPLPGAQASGRNQFSSAAEIEAYLHSDAGKKDPAVRLHQSLGAVFDPGRYPPSLGADPEDRASLGARVHFVYPLDKATGLEELDRRVEQAEQFVLQDQYKEAVFEVLEVLEAATASEDVPFTRWVRAFMILAKARKHVELGALEQSKILDYWEMFLDDLLKERLTTAEQMEQMARSIGIMIKVFRTTIGGGVWNPSQYVAFLWAMTGDEAAGVEEGVMSREMAVAAWGQVPSFIARSGREAGRLLVIQNPGLAAEGVLAVRQGLAVAFNFDAPAAGGLEELLVLLPEPKGPYAIGTAQTTRLLQEYPKDSHIFVTSRQQILALVGLEESPPQAVLQAVRATRSFLDLSA